jgi:hypothetical protein
MPGADARSLKEVHMDNASIIALSKAIKDKDAKEARASLTPGEHLVDVTVRISGALEIAPDTEKASTSSLLSEEFLIIALKMSGCTRERACEIIADLAKQGVNGDAKANKANRQALVEEYDPEGRISAIFADVKNSLPKTKVAGAAKFKGEVVEIAAVDAARQTA